MRKMRFVLASLRYKFEPVTRYRLQVAGSRHVNEEVLYSNLQLETCNTFLRYAFAGM